LAVVLPNLIIGLLDPAITFAGSDYLQVFIGFWFCLVSFGFIRSTYIYFVKFFAHSGFAHHIACLPVMSCAMVSTTVATPSGSLQPKLCLP